MRLRPFGPGAVLVELEAGARTQHVQKRLGELLPDAIVIGAANTVLVEGDVNPSVLQAHLERVTSEPLVETAHATHEIAVVYDGPDLDEVGRRQQLTVEQVIGLHTSAEYRVELMGFLPGFGYLGPLPEALRVPRRGAPRPRVPAFSVGIGGAMTGIYPLPSPGGWNLIGRAVDAWLFDPARMPPTRLHAGDRVRFFAVASGERPALNTPAPPMAARGLRILKPGVCTTVQDGGRPRLRMEGLPPSGPLDAETLVAANLAVGNAPMEAALEIPLGGLEVESVGAFTVSIDGAPGRTLRDGERLQVPFDGRGVHVLAVRGGIDVPEVLQSRATLLLGSLGGFGGRMLRKGDVVGVAQRALRDPAQNDAPPIPRDVVLRVHPGPHLERFPDDALPTLLGQMFTVSRMGDRVGVRLDGARIPREGPDLARPIAMRRGAMQVTTDGTPVILGPDHPVTGGYPVLCVLDGPSQALLGRLPPGRPVRFVMG